MFNRRKVELIFITQNGGTMTEVARFETANFPLPGEQVRLRDLTWGVLSRRMIYGKSFDECWCLITQAQNLDKLG